MSDELLPVDLKGIGEDRYGYDFVLLEDAVGRQLPIWIGKCEAFAIHFKLQSFEIPRPMTHDLLTSSTERLGGRITRLLIDDLWQDVFYAKVCVAVEGEDDELQLDCRPSDGLAIALRADVPVFVRDDVMEEGHLKQPLPGDPDGGAEEADES